MSLSFKCWFAVILFQLRQLLMKQLYTNLRKPIAIFLVAIGLALRLLGAKEAGLKLILRGRRVADVSIANRYIKKVVLRNNENDSELVRLLEIDTMHPLGFYEGRILILKIPSIKGVEVLEKGVIIFKFSETFIRMYISLDVRLLSKYFHLVLEPSSAGYSAAEILVWTELSPNKLVVFSPDDDDYQFLSGLSGNLIPIKLGAADWVNPANFYKVDQIEKKFDSLYIANFNSIKRVDRYIRAIINVSKIKSDFRAALVCAIVGDSRQEIMAMLSWAKGKANITFFDGMPQPELNKLLNQSKVNILLSLKEGANKGLSEGLFSGTPAILLNENVGVKRANINDQTGKIVPDSELEETLIWFSDHHHEFKPHLWAKKHISPNASIQVLEDMIEGIESQEGRAWSSGLFAKVNQPELAYLHSDNDWMLSKRAELLDVFTKDASEDRIVGFLENLQSCHE